MIGKRHVAFGLTMALAAGCAPNTGPDEVEPTRPEVTASASPSPSQGLPSVETSLCPDLPGSYYLNLGAVPVDKVCATAAGIRGMIEGGEKVRVVDVDLPMPINPIRVCALNPIVFRDGGADYFAVARPSKRADVKGAEVTAFVFGAVNLGGAQEHEVTLSPGTDGRGYEAALANSPSVPVATFGAC